MSGRLTALARRWPVALAVAIAAQAAVLGPHVSVGSFTVERLYDPYAEMILGGLSPYEGAGYEYPPLSLPVLLLPGLVSSSTGGYVTAFGLEMLAFGIGISALLAWALRSNPRLMWEALAIFTIGLLCLGRLPTNRFDLAPAALALAAALSREAGRSGLWGAMAGAGAAVKAFPLALIPVLAAGERRLGRTLIWAGVPIGAAAVLVLALGDDFGAAVSYHAGRDLQVETLAASAIIVARELGAEASVTYGAGSFNIDAAAAEPLRVLTSLATLAAWALVVWLAWRRRVPPLAAASAAVAVIVVLGPVLSPQFLIWLLPLSAAAFGLRAENVVLLAAALATGVLMKGYDVQTDFAASFVVPLLIRNALLVAYLALVLRRLLIAPARDARPT